jgi:WD40 repeat protein
MKIYKVYKLFYLLIKMTKLINENILKLIFSGLSLSMFQFHFTHILNNTTICKLTLGLLNYHNIFKSMGKSKHVLGGHEDIIRSSALINDNLLVSVSDDGTLKVWDINKGECIKAVRDEECFKSVITLPDGNTVITSSPINIKLWDVKNDFNCISIIKLENYGEYGNLLLLPNFNLACSVIHSHACVLILDREKDFNIIHTFEENYHLYSFINLGSTNNFAYSAGWAIQIKNYEKGEHVKTLTGHTGRVYALLYIDRSGIMLSSEYDKCLRVWRTNDFTCVRIMNDLDFDIYSIFNLSNGYFASGSYDWGNIRIWDMSNFGCINMLTHHADGITSLFLTRNKKVISTSFDKTIIIWD